MYGALTKGLFQAVWILIKTFAVLLIPVYIVVLAFLGCLVYQYINQRYILHNKPNKSGILPYKEPNVFYKLFYLFPKQLILDHFNRQESAFQEFGQHMAIGSQGSGKTMTMVYLLQKWQKMYPKCRVYTNFEYKNQDGEFKEWEDIAESKQDTYGDIFCVDELRVWFSKKDSGKIPIEVIDNLCQLRKQKQAFFSTIQVFSEAPKEFRDQADNIYVPHTYFGCLTIVFKTSQKYYQESTGNFKKYKGFFFFVHTKELREAYDTYLVIKKQLEQEYRDDSLYLQPVGDHPSVTEAPTAK